MENEKLKELILKFLSQAEFTIGNQYPEVTIEKEKISELARFLKDSEDTAFDYLFCETAVDFSRPFYDVLPSRIHKIPPSAGG